MDDYIDILMEKLDSPHNYGNYVVSICPYHSDTRPSFFIYHDTFRCASCGKWGQTSELVQSLDNLHLVYHQEQSYSYNPFSKWTKERTLSVILRIANQNLPVRYLKDRGIDGNVQSKLHLGLLDGWITFPIFSDKGRIIGAVARAGENNPSKSKYILPYKQDANMLYVPDWARCETQDKLYVTYGILDAVTLYAAGFASMSTTTGKRINPSAFDNIRKSIMIIPDFGEMKEALRLASRLGWRGKVLQLDYPENCKDVNDIIWHGKMNLEQLKEIINEH